MKSSRLKYTAGAVFLMLIVFLQTESRDNFLTNLTLFTAAFSFYFLTVRYYGSDLKWMTTLTLLAHISTLFFLPRFSEDFYRFLWDGQLTWLGINPFDYRPNELVVLTDSSPYMHELYTGMSDLTKGNYSCYPPLNQLYFILCAIGSSVNTNVVILKTLVLITEGIGALYLFRLLKVLKIKANRIWFLFLNPLFIIEATGNLHFEGVMIAFWIIALYYLLCSKWIISALFLALAIQIKLIPLIFLPFLFRYIGFKRALNYSTFTIAIVGLIGLTQINGSNVLNFMESLKLYFNVFEFNSFIQHYMLLFGEYLYGYNPIRSWGPVISVISACTVLYLAFYRKKENFSDLSSDFTFAFFVYLLLSNTVHPWYILPLMLFFTFQNSAAILAWTLLSFLSYAFYSPDVNPTVVRLLINVEYLLVLALLLNNFRKRNVKNVA